MMEMHATRQKTTMMKPLLSLMAWKNIVANKMTSKIVVEKELVMTMLMSVMIRMAIIMVAILEMEMQRSFN